MATLLGLDSGTPSSEHITDMCLPLVDKGNSKISPTQNTVKDHTPGQPQAEDDPMPADKGGVVVVWHTDLYIAEAEHQFSDTFSDLLRTMTPQ
eukprot:g48267.t1